MGKIDLKRDLMPKLILEYRLSIDSVAELLNISKEDVLKEFIFTNKNITVNKAIQYVLNYETINDSAEKQRLAKRNVYMFLNKLRFVKTKKEFLDLYNSLEDDMSDLKGKKATSLSKEEIERLFRYRLKYALPYDEMTNIFGYTKHFYIDNTPKLEDEGLKNMIEELNQYNYSQKYERNKR